MFELSEQVSIAELATELAEARADFIERNSGMLSAQPSVVLAGPMILHGKDVSCVSHTLYLLIAGICL